MELESWFKGWPYYFEAWKSQLYLLKFLGIILLILIVVFIIKKIFNWIVYKFDILISGDRSRSNDISEKRYDDIPYMYKKKISFLKMNMIFLKS